MRHILGIFNEGGGGKYLGLPEEVAKRKAEMFHYIIDRVKAKTQGWSKKFLSEGGKEVLLKAVALAMPVYAMNIFKLPKETCTEINRVLAQFWWSKGEDKQGMHWFAWDRLGTSKKDGGLGFGDIENFNLAFLGKQAWRLFQQPDCLMAKILKGMYYCDTNILNAKVKRKSSYVWRSILQGCALMKQGMRFVIGDGTLINVAYDPWLPMHPPRPPQMILADSGNLQISELLQASGSGWNEAKVRETISQEDVSKVLGIKICRFAKEDYLSWHYTEDGVYTVKSAYWLANQLRTDQPPNPPPGNTRLKAAVWKLGTAPKIKHFLWRMLSGSLATGEILRHRHINAAPTCHRCYQGAESTKHMFFDCLYAQAIWRASGYSHQCLTDPQATLEVKLKTILSRTIAIFNTHAHQLGLWILWRLWKSRNMLVFQQKNVSWTSSLALAKNDAQEWLSANEYLQQLHEPAMCEISTRSQRAPSHWRRPPSGWLKCNYDGSFSGNTVPATAGWIFRDDSGCFKGAGHAIGRTVSDALESEWQALIMAMQNAWARGYLRVMFEGDNKKLTDLLKHRHFASYNWYREVNHWKEQFEDVEFIWTPRTNNKPADLLARNSSLENISYRVYSSVPLLLCQQLHLDLVNTC